MKNGGNRNLQIIVYIFAVIGIAFAADSGFEIVFTGSGIRTAQAQTNPFLDQRINRIEQQLNSIDSRINRLEQYSRVPSVTQPAPGNDDTVTRLLASSVETLLLRVTDLECAAVKLDERTLTDAARKARRPAASTITDPCRSNSGTPLNLSARP